jgi:DNA-directed RNA polymerase subunit RPC12/RpoP
MLTYCVSEFKRDMGMTEKSVQGIIYECVKCGAKVPLEELDLRGGKVKCIICGYRVLKKVRPPVVKRVKTG